MSVSKPSLSRAKKKVKPENAASSPNVSLKTKGGRDVTTRQGSKPSRVERIVVRDAASNSSIDRKKKVKKQVSGRGDVDISFSGFNLKAKGGDDVVRLRNKPLRTKSVVRDVKSYSSSDKQRKLSKRINGKGNVDDDALSSKNGLDVARQRSKPSRVKNVVQDDKSYRSMDRKRAGNKQVHGKENIGNSVSSSNGKMKTKGGPVVVSQTNKRMLGKRSLRDASSDSSSDMKKATSSVSNTGFSKKKSLLGKNGADIENEDMPKKKKKRGIRLDPHDVSNKRLDDSPMHNEPGSGKVKEDVSDQSNVEMSKNAQFRAIRPSASILSFVEDNLLGRRREIEFRRAGYNIELNAPLDNIPFSTSSERERIEVPVFRNKLEFFAAAKVSSSFPSPELPEIAFAGRSNVGKSSLLNSLTRQWGVARTSDKPGLTQTINFFKLGSKLSLVDLPGYGFAYAKEEVKEAWEELVKEYVTSRLGLKRVCLLVDAKWGMKPRDHELIDLMERSQTNYQIVLTKTDLISPIDVARRASQIEENLKAKRSIVQPSMMVSSKTGAGIRSLRTVLAGIARLARH